MGGVVPADRLGKPCSFAHIGPLGYVQDEAVSLGKRLIPDL